MYLCSSALITYDSYNLETIFITTCIWKDNFSCNWLHNKSYTFLWPAVYMWKNWLCM